MSVLQAVCLLVRGFFAGRDALVAENLALRQQLVVLNRSVKRPEIRKRDRIFWVLLSRLWSAWRSSLLIVQPATVVKWHRQGFELYWRWKSRQGKRARPQVDRETRDDWERYKQKHLDPDDPKRFPADWAKRVAEYRGRDDPLQLSHQGVYGFARPRMGDESLALAFYDDPSLVHDIIDTYTDMAIAIWEKQAQDVDFDLIECWEDMASKHGSIVLPATFREFTLYCRGPAVSRSSRPKRPATGRSSTALYPEPSS